MKIAYLITRADLGGAQVHLLDLLRGLRNDNDLHLITGEPGYLTDTAAGLGIPSYVLRRLVHPISPFKDVAGLLELCKLLRDLKPDILHAHTSKAGLLGRFAGSLTGLPVVFTAHTWCFAEGTSWKWRAVGLPSERIAARIGSVIINVSEANRNLALQNQVGKPERLLTIHNGIPDVSLRAHPGSDQPLISVIARFVPQKDQGLLVEALSTLDLPYRLQFIGDGPTRGAVQNKVTQLGLQDKVHFLGNRKDIPELLAASDIFVLPTQWEGFPLSILEAMRAGLPVISSEVGGVAEAVLHGETGLLVPSHNRERLREALHLLLSNPHLRIQMGTQGRTRYESHFDISIMLKKTVATYHSVVRRRRQRQTVSSPLSRPDLG